MQVILEVYKKTTDSRTSYLIKNGIFQISHIIDCYYLSLKQDLEEKISVIKDCFVNQISQNYRIFSLSRNEFSTFFLNQDLNQKLLIQPKLQNWNFNQEFKENSWVIEKSLLSGVKNVLADVSKEIVEEKLRRKGFVDIKTSTLFIGSGKIPDLNSFYNSLVESISFNYAQEKSISFKAIDEQEKNAINQNAECIALDSINQINKSRALNLNQEQISKIVQHYKGKNKFQIYDIELETIAQTWSEHCKHNIFSYQIDDIECGIFKKYIKGATDYIIQNNPDHICASVFTDNAGAIQFDEDHLVCFKVETHNSPSALEPFGGAITGILGVNRDILGFGMCAKPIANYYTFCFDDPDTEDKNLYRDKECLYPKLCAKEIAQGVIEGVNAGGNCSGIPTPQGALYFSTAFCAKPLVFVGCAGIIPKIINNKSSCIKEPKDGDLIVVIGGRTGRDGIHGATFSSSAISSQNTKGTEVQIGDPYIQKKLLDALIKDARDLNLFNAITDNGAGGLSSSVGEMGKDGFIVNLQNVLLKAHNIKPWEVWISESQERMTLAVPEANIKKFASIMQKHDVEYCIIGKFNKSGIGIIKLWDKELMRMDLDFLHNQNPRLKLKTKKPQTLAKLPEAKFSSLKDALRDKNICTRQFIAMQYDHEVQGSSVLKPLQGNGKVFADTCAIKPIFGCEKCIVQSQDLAVISDGPYQETAASIEQAIRNIVAAGANPKKIALLDNFCWSDSTNPKRLWQLKHCAMACHDYSIKFSSPFISGKDSMFNDFKGYNKDKYEVHLRNYPALLITAVAIAESTDHIISLDAKFAGDPIYFVSSKIDNAEKLHSTYYKAVIKKIISSAIAINTGGLIVALAKKAIAGCFGFDVEFNQADMFKKFTGILVTTSVENEDQLEKIFDCVNCKKIGYFTERQDFILNGKSLGTLQDMNQAYSQEILFN